MFVFAKKQEGIDNHEYNTHSYNGCSARITDEEPRRYDTERFLAHAAARYYCYGARGVSVCNAGAGTAILSSLLLRPGIA